MSWRDVHQRRRRDTASRRRPSSCRRSGLAVPKSVSSAMIGRAWPPADPRPGVSQRGCLRRPRRPRPDTPACGRESPGRSSATERIGHPQTFEQLDDVAILQHPRPRALRPVRPVPQVDSSTTTYFVNVASRVVAVLKNPSSAPSPCSIRVSWFATACADAGSRIVQQIPAENAVDAAFGLGKSASRGTPARSPVVPARDVPIDIGVEVLDEDLAAELLAEERHVRTR